MSILFYVKKTNDIIPKGLTQVTELNHKNLIKLTREELTGPHVDDLVQRYKSMKGDSSVKRSIRHWYLRSWFLFGLMGCIGAFVAWYMLEPFFEDAFYIQGDLEVVERLDDPPRIFKLENDTLILSEPCTHFVVLRGDTIWISAVTKIRADEKKAPLLEASKLFAGCEVGIYVSYHKSGLSSFAFAEYIILSPSKKTPEKVFLPLDQRKNRSIVASLLLIPLIAGLIGLFIGAIDGIVCRHPRRALIGGVIGFVVGFVGGFISNILSGLLYSPFNHFASLEYDFTADKYSTFGFVLQIVGRTIAWAVAGMAMGLGQGIALRSKRLLLYGFLGGVLGGMIGGLLFDPIDMLIFPSDVPDASLSRLIGFMVIGIAVGVMIGVVELLSRDAWFRMIEGAIAGKEFLLFKDRMTVGSSPSSDIYLFNDSDVAPVHAVIYSVGDEIEIENKDKINPTKVNTMQVERARLRHGDKITLGKTCFVFEKRQRQ